MLDNCFELIFADIADSVAVFVNMMLDNLLMSRNPSFAVFAVGTGGVTVFGAGCGLFGVVVCVIMSAGNIVITDFRIIQGRIIRVNGNILPLLLRAGEIDFSQAVASIESRITD